VEQSLSEHFATLVEMGYKSGLIMGLSIRVSLGLMSGILLGVLFYRAIHRFTAGKVIMR